MTSPLVLMLPEPPAPDGRLVAARSQELKGEVPCIFCREAQAIDEVGAAHKQPPFDSQCRHRGAYRSPRRVEEVRGER